MIKSNIAYPAAADMEAVRGLFDWAVKGDLTILVTTAHRSLLAGHTVDPDGDRNSPEDHLAMMVTAVLYACGVVKTPEQLAQALDVYLHPDWSKRSDPTLPLAPGLFKSDLLERAIAAVNLGEVLARMVSEIMADLAAGKITRSQILKERQLSRVAQGTLLVVLSVVEDMTAAQAADILDLAFPGEPMIGKGSAAEPGGTETGN